MSPLVATAMSGTHEYVAFEYREAIQLQWHRLVGDIAPQAPTYREICRSEKWAGIFEMHLRPLTVSGQGGILHIGADLLQDASERYANRAVEGCLARLATKFCDLEVLGASDTGGGHIRIDAVLMRDGIWVEIEQRAAVSISKDGPIAVGFPRRILVDRRVQSDLQYQRLVGRK